MPEEQGNNSKHKVGHKRPPREYQFKPGQSGNPGGRPKGTSITAQLRKLLDRNDGKLRKPLAKRLIDNALKGDHRFLETILDRTEGKAPERIIAENKPPIRVILENGNGSGEEKDAVGDEPSGRAQAGHKG